MRFLLLLTLLAPQIVAPAPKTHRVSQHDKQFRPGELRVAVGDSLVFENNDVVRHNVFSNTPGFKFNLRMQLPGSYRAVPFQQRGTATIRCAFHADMRLTVIVE